MSLSNLLKASDISTKAGRCLSKPPHSAAGYRQNLNIKHAISMAGRARCVDLGAIQLFG